MHRSGRPRLKPENKFPKLNSHMRAPVQPYSAALRGETLGRDKGRRTLGRRISCIFEFKDAELGECSISPDGEMADCGIQARQGMGPRHRAGLTARTLAHAIPFPAYRDPSAVPSFGPRVDRIRRRSRASHAPHPARWHRHGNASITTATTSSSFTRHSSPNRQATWSSRYGRIGSAEWIGVRATSEQSLSTMLGT